MPESPESAGEGNQSNGMVKSMNHDGVKWMTVFAVLTIPGFASATPIEVTEQSFKCIQQMTPVRGFFVDNIAGNLEATLAVANSATGGVYPPGSVVQLFPDEAMVKREAGFSPATNDWEFFDLKVDDEGTTIRQRGLADIKNRFGDNCLACHKAAKPEWDMVCETGHGCEVLPISEEVIESFQQTDPRCKTSDASVKSRFTAWLIRVFTPL